MASPIILLTNKNELPYTSKSLKETVTTVSDGLHTMSHVVNFTGRIHLEATILMKIYR